MLFSMTFTLRLPAYMVETHEIKDFDCRRQGRAVLKVYLSFTMTVFNLLIG